MPHYTINFYNQRDYDSFRRDNNLYLQDAFFYCDDCGETYEQNEANHTDGGCYCNECCSEHRSGFIRSNSLKFNFKEQTFFGLEIEFLSNTRAEIVEKIESINESIILHCSEDGSLPSDKGIEIGLQPLSLDYLYSNEFKTVVDEMYLNGYISEKCGLHINVSRRYLSKLTVYKISEFFRKSKNLHFINLVSERKGNFYYCELTGDKTKKALLNKCSTQKFSAINIKEKCYEFRLFAGTLQISKILKNIEFITCLNEYCNKIGILENISVLELKKYITENKKFYKNLYQFLKNNGGL
jgi:hypothetical protein